MSRRRTRALVTAVAVSVVAVVALAGCTGAPAPHPTPSPTARGGQSITGLPSGVTPAPSIPATVPNTPALRADVRLAGCKPTADGWSASGTATNPGDAAATYTITVFFTTTAATVIDSATSKVTVKPHDDGKWTAAAAFAAPAKTLCVLRGVG